MTALISAGSGGAAGSLAYIPEPNRLIEAVWAHDALNSAEKMTMLCLIWHAEGSLSYPPAQRISERTGLGLSTVYRALTGLTEKGLIVKAPDHFRPWHLAKNSICYLLTAPASWPSED